ncbi:MAG: hypothetical protein V3V22_09385 [Methylococcales bacterium]
MKLKKIEFISIYLATSVCLLASSIASATSVSSLAFIDLQSLNITQLQGETATLKLAPGIFSFPDTSNNIRTEANYIRDALSGQGTDPISLSTNSGTSHKASGFIDSDMVRTQASVIDDKGFANARAERSFFYQATGAGQFQIDVNYGFDQAIINPGSFLGTTSAFAGLFDQETAISDTETQLFETFDTVDDVSTNMLSIILNLEEGEIGKLHFITNSRTNIRAVPLPVPVFLFGSALPFLLGFGKWQRIKIQA